jgi:hypothetical protein
MIDDKHVFIDDDTVFNQYSLHFKPTPLSYDKYKLALSVEYSLPNYMKQNLNTRFGCPGCVDQPSIYVADGRGTWWVLDSRINSNPQETRYFANLVMIVANRMK